MPLTTRTTVTGGLRLRAAIAAARKAAGDGELRVGFFRSARYPDGTPVAAVAVYNEFGTGTSDEPTGRIPSRPFFRQALDSVVPRVSDYVQQNVEARSPQLPPLLDDLGLMLAEEVQDSITRLRLPANAPATVARKGSSNPLIDTGQMRRSVTWVTTA